jgi:hypothetical protein
VPIWLSGANLAHGRLGADVEEAILDEASRLDAVALGRVRKRVADLLMTSMGAIDAALTRRIQKRSKEQEGPKATEDTPQWDYPVTDLGAVLDEVVRIIPRYVAAPKTHYDTTALWSVHAHLIHREELGIDTTPRLQWHSPEPDSGKTTFMKIVRSQLPRPKSSGSLSSSALLRAVDARKCTLLVDEGDYVFRADTNPDMAAIFNSGHERAFAVVTRSVPLGEGRFEDQDFHTFTAICFTSIAKLAVKSMQSRCISLAMKPATKEEIAKLKRFRASRCPELEVCGRKIARWAADLPELPDIDVPDEFINRIADNWRSLFQIAHLAGGDWPDRVLAAARADAKGDGEQEVERSWRTAGCNLARLRGRDDRPTPNAHVGFDPEADGPRRWSLAGGEQRQAYRRVVLAL